MGRTGFGIDHSNNNNCFAKLLLESGMQLHIIDESIEGNGLFQAIALGLQLQNLIKLSHTHVQQQCLNFISENPVLFDYYQKKNRDKFINELTDLTNNGTNCGEMSILAASHVFKVKFAIMQLETKTRLISAECGFRKIIVLTYHDDSRYGVGERF